MNEQVTKSKSEGRVAAGKRLVEWNRKNKENLAKNREEVASSDAPSASGAQQEPQSHHTVIYGSGAVAVLVGVGFALYFYRGKKPIPTAHPLESNNDIFRMK